MLSNSAAQNYFNLSRHAVIKPVIIITPWFTQCLLHQNRNPFNGMSPRRSLRTQLDPFIERALKSSQSPLFHGFPNSIHSVLSSFAHNFCISSLRQTSSIAELERRQWKWLEGYNAGPHLALLTNYRKMSAFHNWCFEGKHLRRGARGWGLESQPADRLKLCHIWLRALAWEKKDQVLLPICYVIWTSHLPSLGSSEKWR